MLLLIVGSSYSQCPEPSYTSDLSASSGVPVKLSATSTNANVTQHIWYTSLTGIGTVTPQTQKIYNPGTWTSEFTNSFTSTTTYYVSSKCGSTESAKRTSVTVTISGGSGGDNGGGNNGGGSGTPSPLPSIGYVGSPCNNEEILFYFNTNGNTTCTAPYWVASGGGVLQAVSGNPNQIKVKWPPSASKRYVNVYASSTCNGIYKEYSYPSDGSYLILDVVRSPSVSLAAITTPTPICENNSASIVFSNSASDLPFGYYASYTYYIDDIYVGGNSSNDAVNTYSYSTSVNSFNVPLTAGVHTAKTVMSFSDLPCLSGPLSSVATSSFTVLAQENYQVSISGSDKINGFDEKVPYSTEVITKTGPAGVLRYEWFVDNKQVLAPSSSNHSPTLTVNYGSTIFCKLYSDNSCESFPAVSNKIVIQYPPNNYNWIKENTVLVKDVKTSTEVDGLQIPGGHKNLTWTYFDGLGRSMQSIQVQGSPLKEDIVQPLVYDVHGRESTRYLPYTSGNSGYYKTDFLPKEDPSYNSNVSPQYNFYRTTPGVSLDMKPYAVSTFEPSPLNRVLKQGASGTTWQPNDDIYSMDDKTIKIRYEFNHSNEVFLFKYDQSTGALSTDPELGNYYEPNELLANKTYDEKTHEIIEYIDNEGRIICRKVYVSTANNVVKYASTYYIYDDFDNLVVVLPPEGVEKLKTALNLN